MSKGRLLLIPSPLGDNDPLEVIPGPVLDALQSISTFVVEEVRTARRYLSKAGLKGKIGDLEFHQLNEHTTPAEVESYLSLFDDGRDVGLITEAGLPAVADPGAQLVALCHRHGIEVIPFVGPSSLMLALMASGLNGQSFAFLGYRMLLPLGSCFLLYGSALWKSGQSLAIVLVCMMSTPIDEASKSGCGSAMLRHAWHCARLATIFQVVIAAGSHLFPFRTEKLSPPAPMVLQCNAGE